MSLSFEALLVLGIIGFYLYDSMMLLRYDEVVFSESFGRWTFSHPDNNLRVRNKALFLPNPLTPFKPTFRVAWSPNDPPLAEGSTDELLKVVGLTRPLGFVVMLLLAEMLLVVPAVIFTRGTGPLFLGTLAAVYLTILLALGLVYANRAGLALSNKKFASLAFDSLACPPFAINLLRKITLTKAAGLNPVAYAHQHFTKECFADLAFKIKERLTEAMDYAEDAEQGNALKAYHDHLTELAK